MLIFVTLNILCFLILTICFVAFLYLKYSVSKTPLRACVKGARKIWGTLKSTTVTGVTNTLKVLEKVPFKSKW